MKVILIIILLLPYVSYSQIKHELIPYRKGDYWGFSNKQGELIIDTKYDSVRFFIGELAVVKKGNLFGYINKSGKEVIELKYSSASDFNTLNNFAIVTFKGRERKINDKGKKVNPKYIKGIMKCGGITSTMKFGYYIYIHTSNEKYGFDKWAIVNMYRNQLTKFEFDDIEVHPTDPNGQGVLTKVKQKDKYGFIDEKGKIKIMPKYDKATFFKNGLAIVSREKKWGYISEKGLEYFED